jgi:hypothetical protein
MSAFERFARTVGFDRLSHRDRRAVLLGIAVLAPALLYIVVVRPYFSALEQVRERVGAERALLAREEALLAAAPTLPREIEALGGALQRAELRLVRAATGPAAEAEVASYLENIAGLSRVLLQEMRAVELVRGVVESSAFPPVRLAVRGESDLEGVLTLLHRIESSPLLLRVASLSIEPVLERARVSQDRDEDEQRRPTGAATTRVPTGVIRFAVVVEAFAAPEATRAPSSRSEEVLP